MNRKQVLTSCVFGLLAIGVLFSFVPFVQSLNPAAGVEKPLEINLSAIPKGEFREFEHEGKPLVIYKPTNSYAKSLIAINELTNGPFYKENEVPEFFAYYRMNPYKGCYLYDSKESEYPDSFGPIEGLYDPCYVGYWDYSGRLINEEFSPPITTLKNLEVAVGYKWRKKGVIWFPK